MVLPISQNSIDFVFFAKEESKKETIIKKYGKDKFIDKKNAVTFKLVFKDSGDNNIVPSENDERVFQLIEKKNSSKQYEDYKQYLVKQLARDDKSEIDNKNQSKEELMDKYKKYGGGDLGADDEIEEIEEFDDDSEFNSQNYSDDDNNDDVNSANYEDSDTEPKPKNLIESKPKNLTETKPIPKKKQNLTEEQKKALQMTKPINAKEIELSKNVKMKLYDEYGMPLSNYDYSQHFAKQRAEGELVFKATVDNIQNAAPDIDYKPEEMTVEQKEVYEALKYEGEEEIYEELEDNFVELACQGEQLIQEKQKETQFIFDSKKDNKAQQDNEEMEQKLDKMLNLYEKGGKEQAENEEIIRDEDLKDFNSKKFDSILNEHIEEINQRKNTDEINPVKNDRTEIINEDMIFQRKNIAKIDFEEDIAMQQVMQEDSSDEENNANQQQQQQVTSQTESRKFAEKIEIEGTIIQNYKDQQTLNFVGTVKSERKEKINKEPKKDEEEEDDDEKKDEQKLFPFSKRDKNMTVEEKKARKELVKQFKKERREKKQLFKKKLQVAQQSMDHLQKQQAKQGNIVHVSVYKV